ncbi:hypothetical protein A1D29_02055 [Pasteurellaceae bacterium Orientalotternb1]|nr:hypothetical protein A1D29_02055 [Pasteurellaceae bacterium Orientalotternb1]
MKLSTKNLQRDIAINRFIFLTNRSKLLVFVEICKKLQGTDRLQKGDLGGSIESTTKHNGGYRSRNTSGIFLPKIHTLDTATSGRCVSIEFVARATLRNKVGNRTNKGGYHPLWLVVEPLPRLLSVSKLSLNNITENFTMLFKFLFTGSRLRITVFANNLAEAYTRLPLSQSKPVLIARLPVQGGFYA